MARVRIKKVTYEPSVTENRGKRGAHNSLVAFKKILPICRGYNFRVNMSPKNGSLSSSVTHVNNLPRVSKSDRGFRKLMKPDLKVNLAIRRSLNLLKEGNKEHLRRSSADFKVTWTHNSNGLARAQASWATFSSSIALIPEASGRISATGRTGTDHPSGASAKGA